MEVERIIKDLNGLVDYDIFQVKVSIVEKSLINLSVVFSKENEIYYFLNFYIMEGFYVVIHV